MSIVSQTRVCLVWVAIVTIHYPHTFTFISIQWKWIIHVINYFHCSCALRILYGALWSSKSYRNPNACAVSSYMKCTLATVEMETNYADIERGLLAYPAACKLAHGVPIAMYQSSTCMCNDVKGEYCSYGTVWVRVANITRIMHARGILRNSHACRVNGEYPQLLLHSKVWLTYIHTLHDKTVQQN